MIPLGLWAENSAATEILDLKPNFKVLNSKDYLSKDCIVLIFWIAGRKVPSKRCPPVPYCWEQRDVLKPIVIGQGRWEQSSGDSHKETTFRRDRARAHS